MNDELTIPVFNAADLAATVLRVPTGQRLRLVRCSGAATVRIHTQRPTSTLEEAKGFPLGANAADNELGECLPVDSVGASANALWATATTASKLRVMTCD